MRPGCCKDCGSDLAPDDGLPPECSRCFATLCTHCALYDVGLETLSGDEVTDAERDTCPAFCEEHAP